MSDALYRTGLLVNEIKSMVKKVRKPETLAYIKGKNIVPMK